MTKMNRDPASGSWTTHYNITILLNWYMIDPPTILSYKPNESLVHAISTMANTHNITLHHASLRGDRPIINFLHGVLSAITNVENSPHNHPAWRTLCTTLP